MGNGVSTDQGNLPPHGTRDVSNPEDEELHDWSQLARAPNTNTALLVDRESYIIIMIMIIIINEDSRKSYLGLRQTRRRDMDQCGGRRRWKWRSYRHVAWSGLRRHSGTGLRNWRPGSWVVQTSLPTEPTPLQTATSFHSHYLQQQQQ